MNQLASGNVTYSFWTLLSQEGWSRGRMFSLRFEAILVAKTFGFYHGLLS